MKKKWLALGLAATLSLPFGAVGCKEEAVALTEEQMFARVLEAFKNSEKYVGAITVSQNIEGGMVAKFTEEEILSWTAEKIKISVDPTTLENYWIYTYETQDHRGHYGSIRTDKVFKQGDEYYQYSKGEALGETQIYGEPEFYLQLYAPRTAGEYEFETFTGAEMIQELPLYGLTLANNLAEVKAAYETVLSDFLIDFSEGTTLSKSINVKQQSTGFVFSAKVTYTHTETEKTSLEYTLKTENGRIAEVSQSMTEVQEVDNDGEKGTWTRTQTAEFVIDYAFDTQEFDSLPEEVPQDVEMETLDRAYIRCYKGDIELAGVSCYGDTVETLFGSVTQEFENRNYTVGDWYLDKECTKPIDIETMTLAEFLSIDSLYTDELAVHDGYAFLVEYYQNEYELSKPYQIVFSVPNGTGKSQSRALTQMAGMPYSISSENEIYVNGTAFTDEYLLLENKAVYEIIYRQDKRTDEDYGFGDLIF